VASFNVAVDSAYNQYQATFEAALVAARSGFASVQATLDAVTASADQSWDALATAATIAYNSTERNAWATYVVAAQAAWNAYFATTSGAQSVVMNQQLTAAQVNLLAMPGPAQPQPPVVQPRQLGDEVKFIGIGGIRKGFEVSLRGLTIGDFDSRTMIQEMPWYRSIFPPTTPLRICANGHGSTESWVTGY